MRGPLVAVLTGLLLGFPALAVAQAADAKPAEKVLKATGKLAELEQAQSEAQAEYTRTRREVNLAANKRGDRNVLANKKEPYVDPEAVAARKAAKDVLLAATKKNAGEALVWLTENPKDPYACKSLQWVVTISRTGSPETATAAMTMLARDHFAAEGIGSTCRSLFGYFYLPAAEELIRTVAAKHPDREQKGLAWYGLAYYLQYQARLVQRLKAGNELAKSLTETYGPEAVAYLMKKDPDALDKDIETALVRVTTDFGDIELGAAKKRTLAEIAKGQLFAIRNLKIGQPIPEVAGKDHEEKAFKLSDYKGKVIVLTFSGNWCGPCREMYPHERGLVERMKDKPFALLSVNTDSKRETLADSIKDGTITWRCWWDGSTSGPLSSAWGVWSFPTVFIIDHEGIIRAKDVRDEDLDKAVDSLMAKLPKAAG